MSDIQPTEAEREEVYNIRELRANDGITVWPEFVMDVDEAAKRLARIRADAVKAKRERIKAKIAVARKLAGTPTKDSSDYRWGYDQGLEYVVNYILFDDKEDQRG